MSDARRPYRSHRDLAVLAAARSHLDALDDLLTTEESVPQYVKDYLDGIQRYVQDAFRSTWDTFEKGSSTPAPGDPT